MSAEHGEGLADLFEAIRPHVENEHFETQDDEVAQHAPLKLGNRGVPERGQVDARQHDGRRRADDHRSGGRDHTGF